MWHLVGKNRGAHHDPTFSTAVIFKHLRCFITVLVAVFLNVLLVAKKTQIASSFLEIKVVVAAAAVVVLMLLPCCWVAMVTVAKNHKDGIIMWEGLFNGTSLPRAPRSHPRPHCCLGTSKAASLSETWPGMFVVLNTKTGTSKFCCLEATWVFTLVKVPKMNTNLVASDAMLLYCRLMAIV